MIPTALAALALSACGSESVSVPESETVAHEGAEIFATHCAGCHTLSAAGTQGSGNRSLRVQGPNFDQRVETYDDALFAIHNGGFSGAIMPQNIVVGEEAEQVAAFLAEYSGSDVEDADQPGDVESDTTSEEQPSTEDDDTDLGGDVGGGTDDSDGASGNSGNSGNSGSSGDSAG